ncbi:uncharacterized protein C8A04DRAFT_39955 [Dichotomopilus funicola]|uniref:NECAP PHear domain-containing protein n=1 Tax=Dichotomopilus funicola TaxID=1934379 RepID=A0AAN6UW91_9PEZI|nr:hypothetical protein C8A04DRAFT_39955 [Dichotomopilus funicola]
MDPSATIDPATGQPLPSDAIVRILQITNRVHVYSLPRDAVSTTAGYAAASWTTDPRNHIFTARLRVLETSFTPPTPTAEKQQSTNTEEEDPPQTLKIDILLEDPSTGALFAAAPYTSGAVVEPTTDSSRFFAIRVQDPTSKQKATLGIGFEERSEAFDFGVSLQEAGRALGWAGTGTSAAQGGAGSGSGGVGKGGGVALAGGGGGGGFGGEEEKRDLSLKEGETITVNLAGTRFGRRSGRSESQGEKKEDGSSNLASFALPPPPPPSGRAQKRLSAQQLGFDDGQFGEFA